MTKYRDSLRDSYGDEIASVVGCGLDRLERDIAAHELQAAICFYEDYKSPINKLAIGDRRQAIADYLSSNYEIPSYVQT